MLWLHIEPSIRRSTGRFLRLGNVSLSGIPRLTALGHNRRRRRVAGRCSPQGRGSRSAVWFSRSGWCFGGFCVDSIRKTPDLAVRRESVGQSIPTGTMGTRRHRSRDFEMKKNASAQKAARAEVAVCRWHVQPRSGRPNKPTLADRDITSWSTSQRRPASPQEPALSLQACSSSSSRQLSSSWLCRVRRPLLSLLVKCVA